MILIKTEQEFKAFTGVSVSLSIETLTPHLSYSFAEDEIIKITGDTLYRELLVKYNDGTIDNPENGDQKALLPYVQKPLASLAVYSYMQEGGVSIEDQGIIVDRDKTAFQWQQNKAEKHYLESAYQSLDRLISYLITNKEKFSSWQDTLYHNIQDGLLVNSPREFDKYVAIKSSYRTYGAMLSVMSQVETRFIKPVLGEGLFTSLKGDLVDPSPDNLALLQFIKPAVCHLTIADSIEDLNFEISGNGAFVHSLRTNVGNIKESARPQAFDLNSFSVKHKKKGEEWLSLLLSFLNANASADKYAEFFNSDQFESEEDYASLRAQDENSNLYNGL
mgnify:CR=1 FL=1